MSRLGVITGLAREAECFRAIPNQRSLLVRCAGGNSERADEIARKLVADGCTGLASFGIAGGLQPGLCPGALLIAGSVICPDNSRIKTDTAWRQKLTGVLEGELSLVDSDLCGCDQAVLLSAQKRRLHDQTAAVAVDMESHAVARVAAELSVPFIAVRAIADPVDRDVPRWVTEVIGADGRPRAGAVIAGLIRRPFDVPALMRLGADTEKAIASLRRVALTAGPLLQLSA